MGLPGRGHIGIRLLSVKSDMDGSLWAGCSEPVRPCVEKNTKVEIEVNDEL